MIIRATTTAVYYPIVTRRTGSIRGTGRVRSMGGYVLMRPKCLKPL